MGGAPMKAQIGALHLFSIGWVNPKAPGDLVTAKQMKQF
jgi:hypothetical protein